MKIFGIAGWSGSGKTTLIIRLVPALVRRGVRVATIKHTHHDPLLADEESLALMVAGSAQVLASSSRRFALMAPSKAPSLEDLAARIGAVDLVLVEGFKSAGHEKLEVWDPALGKPMLDADQSKVVAIACAIPLNFPHLPVFHRDDVEAIAGFISSRIGC